MKKAALFFPLLLASCEIIEVVREPILAPPLGLEIFSSRSAAGEIRLALRFQGNNREVYFSGYRIYISTDPNAFNGREPNLLFGIAPAEVFLPNTFRPGDTNQTVTFNGAQTQPERISYPHDSRIDNGVLTSSTLTNVNGGAFALNTPYYIGVYAYSRADDRLSIPLVSNITFTTP